MSEVTHTCAVENGCLACAAMIERWKAKQAALDDLPDRFSLSVFVNAGLPLEMASLALMAARRVLADAESRRQ